MKSLYNRIYNAVNEGIQKALLIDPDQNDVSINYSYHKINNEVIPIFNWGIEDYDLEADDAGCITVTTGILTEGGRESADTTWSLKVLMDHDTYWEVRATCIESEGLYNEGYYIDFNLDKDTDIFHLDSTLEDVLENEY